LAAARFSRKVQRIEVRAKRQADLLLPGLPMAWTLQRVAKSPHVLKYGTLPA